MRKEVLSLQADARSPEHGQYGFLQDLVRHVAYETLSRHERRVRHLAAAAFLRSSFPEEDEIAEVVAAHYVDAYESNPEAADAAEVRRQAHEALVRAGERAQSLAASGEAQRYLTQAAGLTDDELERAGILDRAGFLAYSAADFETASSLLAEAIGLYDGLGETHASARVSGRLAYVVRWQGRFDEALAMLKRAYEVLADDEPDEDLAHLIARLGGACVFAGETELGGDLLARATEMGESLGSPVVLVSAFNARAILLSASGRLQERLALLRQAREIALEHDLEQLGSIYFNLSDAELYRDRHHDALVYLEQCLALARRRGHRLGEWASLAESTYPLYHLGRWDEALEQAAQIPEDHLQEAVTLSLLETVAQIRIHRGDPEEARRLLSLYPETSSDLQERLSVLGSRATVLRAEGRLEEALDAALGGLEPVPGTTDGSAFPSQNGKQAFPLAVEVALALGRRDLAADLVMRVELLPAGLRPPYLDAQTRRLRALLEDDAGGLEAATAAFAELGMPFWVAVCRLEQAEVLAAGEKCERLLEQAREEFERLGAAPWLQRAAAVGPPRAALANSAP